MVEELYEYYQKFSEAGESQAYTRVIGSGNALRNNPVLQKIASRRFGLPLLIPMHHEEAAYGAALTALAGTGIFATIEEAQRLIRYESSSNTSL
jgi:sedoheptulokinase